MTQDPNPISDERETPSEGAGKPGFCGREALVLFILFLFPFFSAVNYKAQVAIVLVSVVLSLSFTSGGRTHSGAGGKAIVVTLWALIGWASATLAWTPAVGEGTERLFKLVIIGTIVSVLWHRQWARDLVSRVATGRAVLALCLGVLSGAAVFFIKLNLVDWRTFGGEGPFAATLALMVAPTLYLSMNPGRRWGKVAIIVALFALPVLASTNLAAKLALLSALAVFALASRAPRLAYVIVGVGGVAIFSAPAMMCLFDWSPFGDNEGGFLGLFGDPSLSIKHRLAIYDFSLKSVCEKPLFGWGLEAATHIPGSQDFIPGLGERQFIPSHPHNMPLHIAMEIGSVGAVIAIAFFGAVLGGAGRHMERPRQVAAALAVITAFLVVGSLSYSAWASWFLYTAIFCGLTIGIGAEAAERVGKRKLLILATEDWYFISHRLPMARGAKEIGFEVTVACRFAAQGQDILREGFALRPLRFFTRNPRFMGAEIVSFLELLVVYFSVRPDVALHVGMKPALLGSCATLFVPGIRIVNLFAGLGTVFTKDRKRYRLLRFMIIQILRVLHRIKGGCVIVQNKDNLRYMRDQGIAAADSIFLLRGSGVDTDLFKPGKLQARSGAPTVTLAGRMLWNKGVGVFVEAARILRDRGVDVHMTLVGIPDYANSEYVPNEQLSQWDDTGIIDWQGYRDDMHVVWRECDIAVFPTYYGEGIPLALLEAGACGLPIVATDTAGCRDIIKDGVNGLLVPSKDPVRLADAIESLLADPDLVRKLGDRIYAEITEHYAAQHIATDTQEILKSIYLGRGWSG